MTLFEAAGFQWDRLHDCRDVVFGSIYPPCTAIFSKHRNRIVVTLNQRRSTPRRQLLLDTQSFSYLASCLIL